MSKILALVLLLTACGGPGPQIEAEGSGKLEPDGTVIAEGRIGIAYGPIKVHLTNDEFGICTQWPINFCWSTPLEG